MLLLSISITSDYAWTKITQRQICTHICLDQQYFVLHFRTDPSRYLFQLKQSLLTIF